MTFFQFLFGRVPLRDNNLANALVNRPMPAVDALGFSNYRYVRNIRALPATSQLWINQGWTQSGFGGLVAGGIVFQSLSDNPNPNQ